MLTKQQFNNLFITFALINHQLPIT